MKTSVLPSAGNSNHGQSIQRKVVVLLRRNVLSAHLLDTGLGRWWRQASQDPRLPL